MKFNSGDIIIYKDFPVYDNPYKILVIIKCDIVNDSYEYYRIYRNYSGIGRGTITYIDKYYKKINK